MRLDPAAEAAGFTLDRRGSVGSTNDEAMALARAGAGGRVWVVADRQERGRGRSGRSWSSPPGNLYASLLLVEPCEPPRAPQLGFVAGVALHRAVSEAVPYGVPGLALKWPNDLLREGAKVAGILVEGVSQGAGGGLAAVIGMGVNLVSHPASPSYPAADMSDTGLAVAALFETLSRSMAEALALWDRGAGFARIRDAWLARAGGIGGEIEVRRPSGSLRGIFKDIDAEGRLVLDQRGQLVTIEAGDVFFGAPRGEQGRGAA
jgi:BirA family biotin operon repressor/biotin-[acetyl-CoA-carboxylase] ligase